MAAASLTPRVRNIVVCDDVTPSLTEAGVHTLEGVRQGIVADVFPFRRDLDVYLLLSCWRPGTYAGWVCLVHAESGKIIRYKPFDAIFDADSSVAVGTVSLENCAFRIPAEYAFEVWFRAGDGGGVQKGETPFFVRKEEV
jgi:hypothetical protein